MEREKDIRILIADDHKLFRSGLSSLLSDSREIFIVGEAEDGEDAVKKYLDIRPDVCLLDISMPKKSGIEAAKEILREDDDAKVLFVSMLDGDEYVYYAYKTGGKGLINKNVMKDELIYAIRTIEKGDKYFGAEWTEAKLKDLAKRFDGKEKRELLIMNYEFTERELEILRMISEGLTSTEISEKLFISKKAVDYHRSAIMQKFNLKSLPDLIKFAIEVVYKRGAK